MTNEEYVEIAVRKAQAMEVDRAVTESRIAKSITTLKDVEAAGLTDAVREAVAKNAQCIVNVDHIDAFSGIISCSRHLVFAHSLKACLIKIANMAEHEWEDNVIEIRVERLPDE